jgi:hypothetical protein
VRRASHHPECASPAFSSFERCPCTSASTLIAPLSRYTRTRPLAASAKDSKAAFSMWRVSTCCRPRAPVSRFQALGHDFLNDRLFDLKFETLFFEFSGQAVDDVGFQDVGQGGRVQGLQKARNARSAPAARAKSRRPENWPPARPRRACSSPQPRRANRFPVGCGQTRWNRRRRAGARAGETRKTRRPR